MVGHMNFLKREEGIKYIEVALSAMVHGSRLRDGGLQPPHASMTRPQQPEYLRAQKVHLHVSVYVDTYICIYVATYFP